MNIVIISGSPRKKQNSEQITARASEFFRNKGLGVREILLSEIEIPPCIHCDSCKKKPGCSQDEKANSINEELEKASAILLISPVYFGGMSGQLKCLLDKTLPLRRDGMKLRGKIGAAIAAGGSRNGGQELALQSMHAWMLVHGMVVVGDDSHFGGTVHSPDSEDTTGQQTVEGTLKAVESLLSRLK